MSTNPDAEQVTATLRDFDRTLTGPVRCAFDGAWTLAEPMAADLSALFDPAIGPLSARATRVRELARAHLAAGRADIANPLRPEEGTHRVTEVVGPHDPLAVFVADVHDDGATVYVLSDTPVSHTEGYIPTDWPTELHSDREGRRVFRLTDRLGGVLGGGRGYVEPPDALASVAQQFVHRLQYGTLPSACDFRLVPRCEGHTALVVQNCGLWTLVWSTCRNCYRAAMRSTQDAYAESVAAAWASVGRPVPQ